MPTPPWPAPIAPFAVAIAPIGYDRSEAVRALADLCGRLPLALRVAAEHVVSRPVGALTQALHNGWFACSVSIRTGAGATFSERLLRITRLFRDPRAAAEFARGEALHWIASARSVAAV